MKRISNIDTILGSTSLVIAGILYYSSWRQSAAVFSLPGDAPPLLFPQLVLTLWIALSCFLIIKGIWTGAGESTASVNWLRTLAVAFVVVLAAIFMFRVGFLVAMPIAMIAATRILGYRRWVINLAAALTTCITLYVVLTFVAGMPLPSVPRLGV